MRRFTRVHTINEGTPFIVSGKATREELNDFAARMGVKGVTDHASEPLRKAALALAKPPLWHCPYCGRSNRADQRFCGQGTVHGCGGVH